ncbi:unnamed protein product [Rotaria sp. Silwood1]|nr:unnamed protein product [Rotaria sp. Silwood1]
MCDFLVHRTHLYKPRLSSILSLAHHHQSSSSNHLLAVLRSDHSIELWNTHDSFTLERTIQPRNASHSPELVLWLEKYLITAGLDGQLIAYDPITFEILTSCHAAGGAIWSITKHETTRQIAVGTETGHVNIYQIDEDATQFSLATSVCKQAARIVSLAWHTTDDDFLVAGSINRIYICSTKQKRPIQQINVGKLSSNSNRRGQKDTIIWCLAVTDDYTVFSGDSSGRTCVWDAVYGTLIRSFQTHRADVLCMTLSSDEQTLFCSGVDSVIVRIELVSPKSTTTTTTTNDSTKQWIKTISIHSHTHDVRSLTLIPSRFATIRKKENNLSNKLMLISGGLDARLLVHDIIRDNSKPPVLWRKCFNFTQHQNKIHQKGNYFLFTYRDYIELWSIGKEGGLNENGEDILERAPKNLVQIKTKHQARIDTVAMTIKKIKDEEQIIIAMGDTIGLHVYVIQGIQFYLNLNNRQIDLFDPHYVEFNSTLNKILANYVPRVLADSNTYISLIDEELLYDVHQLGTLTPWSLLTTLIYTNTKYFNLKTVESHMAISFANFGKYSQWVRLSTSTPQGQQMNYLRFYAHNPDLKSLANSPTVYEITEHINDPIRCPIKQYDFYVSKCPEQVRGTADVFYLRPINGQILESSLWFSHEPLSATIIDQILNRLKLLPDFYNQTKPVETNSSTVGYNVTTSQSTTAASTSIS